MACTLQSSLGYSTNIILRDVSLERLYSVLFTFFEIYESYKFSIVRYPKYYLLSFKGSRSGGA